MKVIYFRIYAGLHIRV